MTCEEKLKAIKARIDGEWDNSNLLEIGELMVELELDILKIIEMED